MGGPGECSQTPPTTISKFTTFPLWPQTKLTQVKAVNKKGWKEIAPILLLNPDPVVCLVGHAIKVPVVIDGCKVAALIDLGAQVSNISTQLCKDLDLESNPWGWLLELGDRGCSYSLPQICGGKPPNSGDWRLQWGCAAIGNPHHGLCWRSSSHGGFKNYR